MAETLLSCETSYPGVAERAATLLEREVKVAPTLVKYERRRISISRRRGASWSRQRVS